MILYSGNYWRIKLPERNAPHERLLTMETHGRAVEATESNNSPSL